MSTKQDIIDSYVTWLNDNGWCYLVTEKGTELFNPHWNKGFAYHSEQNIFKTFKQQAKFDSFLAFDDEIRQFCIENIPSVVHTVFNPAKPFPYFVDNNFYYLNKFKQYQPQGSTYTDIALWDEFMVRLFPNQQERNYIELFIAHMFQKPFERPTFGIMLTSQQGTGKGKLYSILERLLCSQTVSCSSFDDFTNRFTVALHETLLCLLDDVIAKGDKQMSTLKSKITEKRQKFEAKGQQPIQENCYTRIFLASNEKRPLRLDLGDRRWYCPTFIQHKESPAETADFISKLSDWLDNQNGYDAVYNHLMSVNVSAFDPNKHIPTQTLSEMIGASKSVLDEDLEDYLQQHPAFGFKEICSQFDNAPEDLLKQKLIDLGCEGLTKQIRLLKNHSEYPSNARYVFHGDRQKAIDYLVSGKTQIPF